MFYKLFLKKSCYEALASFLTIILDLIEKLVSCESGADRRCVRNFFEIALCQVRVHT